MAGIARGLLVGNLTRAPELRHTQGGRAVCTLSVAVNAREKTGGEWREYVSYFDVTVFGNQGEACAQHLDKGSPVGVDGRLKQERWEQDGQKRYAVKIIADSVQFLPRSGGGGNSGQGAPTAEFAVPTADFNTPDAEFRGDDDIPF